MTIDNIAIRLDLTGMWSYFYFTSYFRKWKSLENSEDFFVKTKTKTLLFVPRRRLETKTLVTAGSLVIYAAACMHRLHTGATAACL